MPSAMRAIEHIPASLKAVSERASHLDLSSRWGAGVLLVFLLLITAAGVTAWRVQLIQASRASVGESQSVHSGESAHAQSTTLNVDTTTDSDSASAASQAPADDASGSAASAYVEVNGQPIAMPENGNGTVHKEITNNGSKTTVDISVSSNASGSDSSSTNLNVHTRSDQSTSIDN